MQLLDLDFQKQHSAWPLPGIILLLAGIGLTAMMIQHDVDVGDELARSESHVARLKRDVERQRLFDARAENRSVSDTATTIARRSREQWEALFGGFEAAADETVTLLSFEPGTAEISLRGEARDFAAMTEYIKRLSAFPVAADVRLTEHEIARDHPRRPLRFSVQARWKEAPR